MTDGQERPRRRRPAREAPTRRAAPDPERRDGSLLPAAAARRAAEQIVALTGRELETVVSVERDGEAGWRVGVEVVETRRIPDSVDILAVFEVQVDGHGDLAGFRRTDRYSRGQLQKGGR